MAARKHVADAPVLPPHMLEGDHLSNAQQKAFAKAKSGTTSTQKAAKKASAKKGAAKKTARAQAVASDSGYQLGAEKDSKP